MTPAATTASGETDPMTLDASNLMANTFPECECFNGRKRLICRNEAGLPLNGPQSTNAYRQAWGLPIIGNNDTTTQAKSSRITKPLTIGERVATFAATMADTAARGSLADQSVIAERLAICQACEYFTGKGCSKCGCACNSERKLMNKIAHHAAECPLKKWVAK